jgi:hypothetical protein
MTFFSMTMWAFIREAGRLKRHRENRRRSMVGEKAGTLIVLVCYFNGCVDLHLARARFKGV